MNTRISAIATSVYVLVTVMPRYSRSILSSILQGKPRSARTGGGPTLRTVRNTPVRCTVKLIPLNRRRKRNLRSPFALVPKSKIGQSLFQLTPLGPETGAIRARTFRRRRCRGAQTSTPQMANESGSRATALRLLRVSSQIREPYRWARRSWCCVCGLVDDVLEQLRMVAVGVVAAHDLASLNSPLALLGCPACALDRVCHRRSDQGGWFFLYQNYSKLHNLCGRGLCPHRYSHGEKF
jgi:hypothetical protein